MEVNITYMDPMGYKLPFITKNGVFFSSQKLHFVPRWSPLMVPSRPSWATDQPGGPEVAQRAGVVFPKKGEDKTS